METIIKIIKYTDGVVFRGKNKRTIITRVDDDFIQIQFHRLVRKDEDLVYLQNQNYSHHYIANNKILISNTILSNEGAIGLMSALNIFFSNDSPE